MTWYEHMETVHQNLLTPQNPPQTKQINTRIP